MSNEKEYELNYERERELKTFGDDYPEFELVELPLELMQYIEEACSILEK